MSKKIEKINIAKSKSEGECRLKCNYRFDYPKDSQVLVENAGQAGLMINTGVNVPKVTPVKYNGNDYNPAAVVFQPVWGLFKIRGRYPRGMIMIPHIPKVEGPFLIVCIPLTTGSVNNAGGLVSDVIRGGMREAPRSGTKTNLKLRGYSLNVLVPKKPFYSFQLKGGMVDLIVFDEGASIEYGLWKKYLSFTAGQNLNSWMRRDKYVSKIQNQPSFINAKDGSLFYNKDGAKGLTYGDGTNDVYIVCEPTDQAEDNVFVKMENYVEQMGFDFFSGEGGDDKNIMNNPWFQAFLLLVVILVFYGIVFGAIKYLKPKNANATTEGVGRASSSSGR